MLSPERISFLLSVAPRWPKEPPLSPDTSILLESMKLLPLMNRDEPLFRRLTTQSATCLRGWSALKTPDRLGLEVPQKATDRGVEGKRQHQLNRDLRAPDARVWSDSIRRKLSEAFCKASWIGIGPVIWKRKERTWTI